MEAREVVEQQEREDIASKKQQAEADKQMSRSLAEVGEIAKSFNIDPDKLVELIEPLINELGGVLFVGEDPYDLGVQTEAQQQDKKRLEELTGRGKQATAQVEQEVARLSKLGAEKERLAVTSSEARVLAKRAKEKKSEEERELAREKQLQQTKKKQEAKKKAAKKQVTGLEDKKKYPDERLLKRLQDLENRNIGIGRKLSNMETKEMETIKKEVKARKLTPLGLG